MRAYTQKKKKKKKKEIWGLRLDTKVGNVKRLYSLGADRAGM